MSVVNVTELSTVSAARKFGEPPTFQRQWVVEVDDPQTTQTDIVNAAGIGVSFLTPHPEASYCLAMNASVQNYEGSRWHYLVTWDYELPKQQNVDPNPLNRADVWKFSTSGMAVPALFYYAGSGNNDRRTLVNTAGDFFEGAMTDLSVLKAHISGNRAHFDYNTAALVTNCVNDSSYLGGDAYTWKCDGISGQPAVEVVNDTEIRYWQVEVELTYNPTGHALILPNVGWNYISSGTKKRVYVIDPDSGDRVPASNPQPLDSGGGIVTASPGESNPPTLITRRVHKAISFSTYFGTPPSPS